MLVNNAIRRIRSSFLRKCRSSPFSFSSSSSSSSSSPNAYSQQIRARKSLALYEQSIKDPSTFWDNAAKNISWARSYDKVLQNGADGRAKWFEGGMLNTCYNCLDRHISDGLGEKTAIIYDSPVTNTVKYISYRDLHKEVIQLAAVMRHRGLVQGDRVIIYMPNIPEALVSMLACARLGLVHSVVFGGFASNELATRIKDCQPKMVIAASCGIDGSKVIDYKTLLDRAIDIAAADGVQIDHCMIYQRSAKPATLITDRDSDMLEEMQRVEQLHDLDPGCVDVRSEDPLYVLYTSGTTGAPKGIVRDTGGHAVAVRWSIENVYGAQQDDVFWSASDVGWVVGHSFIVYGPLLQGCTTLLYEGKPVGTPDASNYWRLIEKHKVTALFTAPTALRAIKREDEEGQLVKQFDTSSLNTIFVAGERADPATLKWMEGAFDGRVPVRDNWWQTETGWPICANMIGLDGALPIKYGSSFTPCPGYEINILDDENKIVHEPNVVGNIAIKLPLPPGVLYTLFNAEDRFKKSYLTKIPGYYDTGDAGMVDSDGYVHIMSRTDDVMNVAGHRLSSGAMEEVLSDHPDVAEVAVIGVRDDLKGHLPLGLIVLNAQCSRSPEEVVRETIAMVRDRIGAVAAFKNAVVVNKLPKTRSGKILRATMRAIANGDEYKEPATIEDAAVLEEVAKVIRGYEHIAN